MKKFILPLLLALVTASAFAQGGSTKAQWNGIQGTLDMSATAGPSQAIGTKLVKESVHTLHLIWNYSTNGGAVGTSNLLGEDGKAAKLPSGAIVRDCLISVETSLNGLSGATIALGTGQAGNDLKAALAFGSYTGLVACIPVGTAATAIKLTADRTPTVTIGTSTISAGKMSIWVDYVLNK